MLAPNITPVSPRSPSASSAAGTATSTAPSAIPASRNTATSTRTPLPPSAPAGPALLPASGRHRRDGGSSENVTLPATTTAAQNASAAGIDSEPMPATIRSGPLM